MMQPSRVAFSPLASILAGGAALVLAGCAEAPPPLATPAGSEPPPSLYGAAGQGTSPVDSEMVAIGKSEEEIDRALPRAGKEQARKGGSAQGADKKADRAGDKSADPAQPSGMTGEGDGCATACRALASMARAADHLCSLAGEGDGRCDDARGRVRGASARVRSACPTCAAQP